LAIEIFELFFKLKVRLIVDTGIHAFGWSKEKAVKFILDNTISNRDSALNQVKKSTCFEFYL